MSQTSFEQMTTAQLRAYVLEHREDEVAFHVYMDRLYAAPKTASFPAGGDMRAQIEEVLRRRRGEH
ncbi:DUF6887 family protein [Gloeobacter violaceus]|uniref:Gsr3399 protein n=1 Tax=Gloeobacter violaceus (strain ATCC 29082 / PCC 7421) TaxID=251221 RepID=Q7NFX5_GLOVI|nr:hypothetical protein [Gloeobacter violaceus]BAC91340.1 gsr3399 [Gloeobacter violaceus PCC 7421]